MMNAHEMNAKGVRRNLLAIANGIISRVKNTDDEDLTSINEEGSPDYDWPTFLNELVEQLDDYNSMDFFGSEGWEHYFGLAD